MRVFVSSVMDGFEVQRRTVREAVSSLGMQAVMAEDFGARPHSPREACLAEVRCSNVYLGVLGERYGSPTKRGVSVTEEEFGEARRRGIPILFLIADGRREAAQDEFIKRIGDYDEGYHLAKYTSTEDLILRVTKALSGLQTARAATALDGAAATRLLTDRLASVAPQSQSETGVGAAIIPLDQGEEHISIEALGDAETHSSLTKALLFGDPPVFSTSAGTGSVDEVEFIRIVQPPGTYEPARLVELRSDGGVVWRSDIEREDRPIGQYSILNGLLIDQDRTEEMVTAFLTFARVYFKDYLSPAPMSAAYVLLAVFNGQNRLLGRRPAHEPDGVSLGMGQLESPLFAPPSALKLSLSDLSDAAGLAHRLVALLERVFKAKGQYFPSPF